MLKEILLPVDLQQTALSDRAIEIAQGLSDTYGAAITVVTVIPDFGMPLVANFFPEDMMKTARNEVCAELERFIEARFKEPARVKSGVGQGSPHKFIVDYAEKHPTDLIIMPSRAKDIGKVFLGSSATHVVEQAPCSVLVVRPG